MTLCIDIHPSIISPEDVTPLLCLKNYFYGSLRRHIEEAQQLDGDARLAETIHRTAKRTDDPTSRGTMEQHSAATPAADLRHPLGAETARSSHFSVIIKEVVSISASDYIEQYLATQAKKLLTSRPDLSVQQISDHLGYADSPSFCRFFKRHTGITPSASRQQG